MPLSYYIRYRLLSSLKAPQGTRLERVDVRHAGKYALALALGMDSSLIEGRGQKRTRTISFTHSV